jgi:uncharacterized membrane protein (UPF0127 family)
VRFGIWQVVVVATVVVTACSSGDGRDLRSPGTAGAVPTPSGSPQTAPGWSLPTTDPGSTNTTSPTSEVDSSNAVSSTTEVDSTNTMTSTSEVDSSNAVSSTTEVDSTNTMTSGPTGVEPVGFDTVAATITAATGEVCEVCLWVADTPVLRRRGLMEVTDLGVGDGMVFRYAEPTSTTFWMKNTPMPLSIAFFDAEGVFLESFDMEPCPDGSCTRYATPSNVLDGIEFAQGTLADFGVGPGSMLAISELPCD